MDGSKEESTMPRGGGFTLLEMMVALAVAAVLVALATPAFRDTLLNTRRERTVSGLTRALHLARSESLRSGRPAVVCRLEQSDRCAPREADWSPGWHVFVKQNDADTTRLAVGDRLLLEARAADGNHVTSNRDNYVYRPFNRRSTNGTLVICDDRGTRAARAVIVSHTGRPRVADQDAGGEPLTCPDGPP
jgi:type IV fimbrial biogenesis protein FimT